MILSRPLTIVLLTTATAVQAAVSWTVSPFNPPAIPLAVKSPYLSTWLPQGQGTALNDIWATFWAGQITAWSGYVRVDGKTYTYMGAPAVSGVTKAVQKSFKFTATQSIFVLSAGPVDVTVTFLSPIEPNDLVQQSLPFSYKAVSVKSTDGASHSVQVYSDITGEWVSGQRASLVTWKTTTDGPSLTHEVQLEDPSVFAEVNDQAQYGSFFYSTLNVNGVTYQSGGHNTVRGRFVSVGSLPNTQDDDFRAIENDWPTFGIAKDFGNINAATEPVVFSVGHVRDPIARYITAANKRQPRHGLYWSAFSTPAEMINSVLKRYNQALTIANAFDSKIDTDAKKISDDYAGIVALSVRQTLAAIDFTISKNEDGSWNKDDILVFMKEISSNGNTNTVDVIFPAWPLFLYTNPRIGKYLLEVLFRYQDTGMYPNKWSIHDIGAHFPVATGHNDGQDEAMPVEECGNMLIMSLSYARATGDNSHLTKYTRLLEQWTEFLITDALIPASQLSTDDFAGHLVNQTNLAIKGIIGIRAMADIETILGDTVKAKNYTSIAQSYVTQFLKLAASSNEPHLTLSYNNPQTWGLTYNLYADKLLGFNLFPQSLYQQQTAWYNSVRRSFGIPLDTRHTYTKSDWEIWTAVISTDVGLRNFLISSVKKWASSGTSTMPFGDWYETTDGAPNGFRARPVAGGHLAFLVLPGA